VILDAKRRVRVAHREFLREPLRDLFLATVTRECVERFECWTTPGSCRSTRTTAPAGEHADLLFALLSLCWWRQRT